VKAEHPTKVQTRVKAKLKKVAALAVKHGAAEPTTGGPEPLVNGGNGTGHRRAIIPG
jgi:hypothetical protein